MRRTTSLLIAILALGFAARAQAQGFYNFWTQCTPGSLRACSSTEIGFLMGPDIGGPTTLLLVRLSNLQGFGPYQSGPRGLKSVSVTGLAGTPPAAGPIALTNEHFATSGNVTTTAELDAPHGGAPRFGFFDAAFDYDRGSFLFGCDLQIEGVVDVFPFYDQTCNGSITYAVTLRGQWGLGETVPSIGYTYHAWEDGAFAGTTSCVTGVDCAMVTPEPVTTVLMATGLLGIGGVAVLRRRRRTSSKT
jgi:hypothetical protein